MNDIPHATLITGGTKTSRYSAAIKLVRKILGEEPPNHPDFIEIKKGTVSGRIGIDQIRELKKVAHLKPYKSERKVILIEDAQDLTFEAQNSILKLLEEPPGLTFFILTEHNARALLPTITSRCRQIKLKAEVDIEFDSKDYQKTASDFTNLLKFDIGQRFNWVEENLSTINYQLSTIYILNIWAAILRDILCLKYSFSEGVLNKKFLKKLIKIQSRFRPENIIKGIDQIEEAIKLLRTTNVDKRLLLEVILLELPTPN